MEKISTLVLVIVVVLAIHRSAGKSVGDEKHGDATKQPECALYQFFDHGTEDCEPCQEICDHVDTSGTELECQEQCDDYLRSKNCTLKEYYDVANKRCVVCDGICHTSKNDTSHPCFAYCYERLRPDTSNSQDGAEHTADQQSSKTSGTKSFPLTVLVVILGTVVVALFVAFVLAVAVYCVRRGTRAHQRDAEDADENLQMQQQQEKELMKYPQRETVADHHEGEQLVTNTT